MLELVGSLSSWKVIGILLDQFFGPGVPLYEHAWPLLTIQLLSSILMLVSVCLFIPYLRLKPPRQNYKKRRCVVIALGIYTTITFVKLLIFVITECNLDSFFTIFNTRDENSLVGGLLYKSVMFILYFNLVRIYVKFAQDVKKIQQIPDNTNS